MKTILATHSKQVEVKLDASDIKGIVVEELCKLIKVPVADSGWMRHRPLYRLDTKTNEIVHEYWDRHYEVRDVIRPATELDHKVFDMINFYLAQNLS